jgi:hypothetical protein
VFVTGTFTGTFVAYGASGTAFATRQPTNAGGTDVFVVKYSSTGTVSWVGNLSSVAGDQAPAVVGTSDGGCAVACSYGAALVCYDSGGNSATLAFAGTTDVALAKYDGAGKLTVNGGTGWLARVGNAGVSGGGGGGGSLGLCVGPDNGIYVAGAYGTGPLTVYDRTLNAYATTLPKSTASTTDGFVVKFTDAGSVAVTSASNPWMTHVGSPNAYAVSYSSIAVATDGGLVACGSHASTLYTYSTTNNATQDAVQPANAASNGTVDSFVIKYTPDGVKSWVTTFRGTSSDVATDVAVAADGGIVVAGYYGSTTLTIYTGAGQSPFATVLANGGGNDTFVAKLNLADGTVAWVSRFSGALEDTANAMTVLGDGGVVVGGSFTSQPMYVYDKLGAQYGLNLGPVPLYPFTTFTFTPAGVTGATGPTLAQVRAAYSSYSWAQSSSYLNMTTQGIQLWTVPYTGSYLIKIAGASGGTANGYRGGYGRIISTSISLTQGQVIKILVGQAGGVYYVSDTAGYPGFQSYIGCGGGGTFVTDSSNNPIIVAGGGGGGVYAYMMGTYAYIVGRDAAAYNVTSGTAGVNLSGVTGNAGGTAGGGGGSSNGGSGGGGLTGSGTLGQYGGGVGTSFTGGGTGGANKFYTGVTVLSTTPGGFGGGSGAGWHDNFEADSGAGGGYSGGGGSSSNGGSGGGGGNYVGSNATDCGFQSGDGYVTFTLYSDAYLVKMDPTGLMV